MCRHVKEADADTIQMLKARGVVSAGMRSKQMLRSFRCLKLGVLGAGTSRRQMLTYSSSPRPGGRCLQVMRNRKS